LEVVVTARRISQAKARQILSEVPEEKAFHFYEAIGIHTGRLARSLVDFCNTLPNLSVKSIEFHTQRGDFEKWIRYLQDNALASQIGKLRGRKSTGEALRTELYNLVKKRVDELQAKL
jgi:hypothetical protein